MAPSLKFSRIPGSFAVCRLAANTTLPEWAIGGAFFSVTSTAEELSIVCPEANVPGDVQHEKHWACFKLHGPFPFAETGILLSFIRPLSENAVPVFAVSTFDTDYVLVKENWVETAIQVLTQAGHGYIDQTAHAGVDF